MIAHQSQKAKYSRVAKIKGEILLISSQDNVFRADEKDTPKGIKRISRAQFQYFIHIIS